MLEITEKRLNSLKLKCRRPVQHLLAGHYQSVFRGQGIEFEDVRLYQPGDDVRAMDWKVTARTGEPHVRRYIEEREQHVYLLVDLSASMLHGKAGWKRQTAAEVCALLTFAAIENQDRVGLILFTSEIEHIVPPGKSRSHAMRILDGLVNFKVKQKGTDFANVLNRFGHIVRKHSVVFFVSDFMAKDYGHELRALGYRQDVNAIRIHDSSLRHSGAAGLVKVSDSETDRQRVIDFRPEDFERESEEAALKQELLESNVDLLDIEAGSDCVEALAGFFHARKRREIGESGG